MPILFGFPEFLTALALLVLVYNASDSRYRFRISAATLPLHVITFVAILVIGTGTLLIDLWYAEGWPTRPGLVGQAGLQAVFASAFLGIVVLWVQTAFLRPPKFNPSNAKFFYRALYRRVMQGDAKELAVAAEELASSMDAIVKHAGAIPARDRHGFKPTEVQSCAHDLLMLMGNRRFCKHVVQTAPQTAIQLFDAMHGQKRYRIPVRAFVQNLMVEALRNPDSILYDEADEFSADLVGVAKPFSNALFGRYEVVESLHHIMASPVDLSMAKIDLAAAQFEAYGSASLLFVEAYLAEERRTHSYALMSIFDTMKWASSEAYQLSDIVGGLYDHEQTRKVRVEVRFIERVVALLVAAKSRPVNGVKPGEHQLPRDIFDRTADLMLEVIEDVAAVGGDPDRTWGLHYSSVWSHFFGYDDARQWVQIRRRLVRRLYAHIGEMDRFANYQSARLLGYCLNVLGVEAREGAARHGRVLDGFHRLLIQWFRENYLTLRRDYPDVAEACLIGGVTFDEANSRLVKTYAKLTRPEPARRFMVLSPARAERWDRFS